MNRTEIKYPQISFLNPQLFFTLFSFTTPARPSPPVIRLNSRLPRRHNSHRLYVNCTFVPNPTQRQLDASSATAVIHWQRLDSIWISDQCRWLTNAAQTSATTTSDSTQPKPKCPTDHRRHPRSTDSTDKAPW